MKKKIIGILFCMLLIAAAVLPVAGIVNNNVIEDQTQVGSELQYDTTSRVDDEWPMFLYDPQNTGYSTAPIAPQTNTVKWTYTTDFFVFGSPVIVNGKVYIGSDDETFYCLDADTGEKLWDYSIPGGASVSSPAVADGKVYQGSTYDYVYCWDADTGGLIWTYPKVYGIPRSPAVVGGKVYISKHRGSQGNDGWLYCLDADTGDELWKYDMGWFELSSPAVYGGKVYLGSEDHKLYCFDAENGSKLWEYNTGGKLMFCEPTLFNGSVYCGGADTTRLDAETGEKIWSFGVGTWISPAIAYGKIYFLGKDGYVYCLNVDTGEEVWKCSEGSTTAFSPVVADWKVYMSIDTGKLICLDADTGEKIWEYQTATPGVNYNSPAIAYGRLYIGGGGTNKVYCFEDPSKPPQDPTINGPTDGLIDRDCEFRIRATDPEGNDVKYYVDWGDGTNTSWIGPYSSGEKITLSHAWSEIGTYSVRVRAEDSFGFKSHWSEHVITVVDASALEIQVIKGGLSKVSTVVKNYGSKDASDVSWSIILDGGFILLGRETTGTIDSISVDGEASVNSGFIFGLGSTMVMVNATVPVGFSDTREQKASVFLFFINVKPGG